MNSEQNTKNQTMNQTMNYNLAVRNLMKKRQQRQKEKSNIRRLYQMPKGWILIQKNGNIISNKTKEELEDDEKYYLHEKLRLRYIENFDRLIKQLYIDMSRDGYSEVEIEEYIEQQYYNEDEDELSDNEEFDDEYSDESDYGSY